MSVLAITLTLDYWFSTGGRKAMRRLIDNIKHGRVISTPHGLVTVETDTGELLLMVRDPQSPGVAS